MNRDGLVSAGDIMKYHFCPRIVYYMYVLKSPQAVTVKEKAGQQKDIVFRKTSNRAKLGQSPSSMREDERSFFNPFRLPKRYNVPLSSHRLGVQTIIDCIAIDYAGKKAYPIQAKYASKPQTLYRSQREQILMEALLIEDQLGLSAPCGFIKFLKTGGIVKIDCLEKQSVLETANRIRELVKHERFPEPTPHRRKCIDCCYRGKCWGMGSPDNIIQTQAPSNKGATATA